MNKLLISKSVIILARDRLGFSNLSLSQSQSTRQLPRNWPIAAVTRDCNRLMTEKLFGMELIPSGVFDDLPIELNVWPTRLSEILDMSLSIILFFECG